MRAISLLYHDVVSQGDYESSGLSIPGANRYKLDVGEFGGHLAAIARALSCKPASVLNFLGEAKGPFPVFLTFDDGGSSAWTCIAGSLERYGWNGHFFITVDYIGARGFVGTEQIRALRKRGHVIGSHSCSHPERMSSCSWQQLVEEWGTSIKKLSDILGEEVSVASVPGGYYSRKVAEAASCAGIKALFNSEPTARCHRVNGCLVLGRYTMFAGMSAGVAAGVASGQLSPRLKQLLFWNSKKVAKSLLGESWLRMRKFLLGRRRPAW